MNTAIIVAAGSGRRFGGETPKQFLEIHGKPLLVHTLERFQECAEIDEIVLVLAEDFVRSFSESIQKYNFSKLVKTLAGGRTRAESVFKGLQSVREDCRIVAVHDGARPLVRTEEISQTVRMASKTGAACLAASVTDTIKEISDGQIQRTIDRTKLRRALTPQTFQREILQKAFAAADLSEAVTDECYLVEKLGVPISIVEGSAENIKITTAADLLLAEHLLKNLSS